MTKPTERIVNINKVTLFTKDNNGIKNISTSIFSKGIFPLVIIINDKDKTKIKIEIPIPLTTISIEDGKPTINDNIIDTPKTKQQAKSIFCIKIINIEFIGLRRVNEKSSSATLYLNMYALLFNILYKVAIDAKNIEKYIFSLLEVFCNINKFEVIKYEKIE